MKKEEDAIRGALGRLANQKLSMGFEKWQTEADHIDEEA